MKKLFVFMCALVCASVGVRADSVQFSETYTESVKGFSEEGETFYERVSSVGYTISGSVTIPGLSSNSLDELSEVGIGLGDVGLGFSLDDENVASATANRIVFDLTVDVEDEEDSHTVKVGKITLTRSGNVLSFTITVTKLPGEASLVAANYAEPEDEEDLSKQSFEDQIPFGLSLGEGLEFERTLYYKGTATFKRERKGSGEEAETFILATVNVNGSADYSKPTISITAPKPNQRISNEVFIVVGEADDNGEVAGVNVRVNDGEFDGADYDSETGIWSAEVALTPGTNTVEAFAVDADGNVSSTAKVKCIYVLTSALTLIVSDGGTVMGVTNGQVLEVGHGYKATAKPGPTNLFSYWSNQVMEATSTNAVLSFLMEEDLVLEAHFIPNPWLPNAGVYNGLFLPVADAMPTNSGFVTMKLTDKGKLTGEVTQGSKTRSFMGQVDLDGHVVIQITSAPALRVELMFDLAGGTGDVEGSVSNAVWQAPLHAERQRPDPALVGRHTFAIPGAPAEQSTNHPAGDGAGVLTVKADGSATVAGNLGEGAPLTAGSGLSKDGDLPVHAVQFGGRGFFIGWLNVSTGSAPLTVTGESLTWLKPSGLAKQKTYLDGFNEVKSLMGARYTPPPKATNVLNWTNGAVLFDGGLLTSTISNVVTVAKAKLAAPGNTNKISLSVTAKSGKLDGSILLPGTKKGTTLNGYILQMPDGDVGKGWFIRSNESGYIDLQKLAP